MKREPLEVRIHDRRLLADILLSSYRIHCYWFQVLQTRSLAPLLQLLLGLPYFSTVRNQSPQRASFGKTKGLLPDTTDLFFVSPFSSSHNRHSEVMAVRAQAFFHRPPVSSMCWREGCVALQKVLQLH